jgi:hypothetical protein
MQLITIGLLAAISAVLGHSHTASAAPTGVASAPAHEWMNLANSPTSLSWSGEDETFSSMPLPEAGPLPDVAVNVELLTALAAPEPPAIVLAGMAIGGLVCGRSLLTRNRRNVAKEAL